MILGQKPIIGIDVEENSCVAVEVTREREQICLGNYKVVANPKELIQGPAFKERSAVISLPTQTLLFRSFLVGNTFLKAKDQKRAILNFLQRQNLPLKLDDCFWDTFIFSSYLNLVAAKKEMVEKYITQIKDAGFIVSGIVPSFVALYNLLIYNYGTKEKFLLANIRNLSTDLLIFEEKRFWIYPLPMGRQYLKDNPETQNIFIQEIQRTLNTHYIQNPARSLKAENILYLNGIEHSENFINSFKKIFVDYEIATLEPFNKIIPLNKTLPPHPEIMTFSLSLGIGFLEIPRTLKVNLLKEKIKKEVFLTKVNILKESAIYAGILITFFLLFLNIKLAIGLKIKSSALRKIKFQVDSLLPELKVLRETKQNLQRSEDFLAQKLNQQLLYLRSLGVIAESKSPFIKIEEVEAKTQAQKIEVFLSGIVANYEEINELLNRLKENKNLKNVKVVASSPAGKEGEPETINFKLRFEIE